MLAPTWYHPNTGVPTSPQGVRVGWGGRPLICRRKFKLSQRDPNHLRNIEATAKHQLAAFEQHFKPSNLI